MSYSDLVKKYRNRENNDSGEVKQATTGAANRTPTNTGYDEFRKKYSRASKVDTDFVSTFFQDAESFLSSATDDYTKVGWGNASESYSERYKSWKSLDERSAAIRAWAKENESLFDPEDYKTFSASIDDVMTGTGDVLKEFKNAKSYYGQWATETDYQQELEWQQNYNGKSYGELSDIIEGLADGKEKEWLEKYAPTVKTKGDYDVEIAQKSAEWDTLQANQDRDRDVESWYLRYQQNPGAWANQPELVDEYLARRNELAELYGEDFVLDYVYDTVQNDLWNLKNERAYKFLNDNEDYHDFAYDVSSGKTGDGLYNYINNIDNTRGVAYAASMNGGNAYGIYDHMEDEEIDNYNYLYHKEGENAANAYLKYLEYTLNDRVAGVATQNAQMLADEYPVFASAISIPASLISGVGYLSANAQKLMGDLQERRTGEYAGPVDYNTSAFLFSRASSTIRGTVAQNIADETGAINIDADEHPFFASALNGKSLGDVYQLGMSMADSGTAGALGKVGSVLLGGSAATSSMLDAIDRGATDEQALEIGLFAGAAEMAFESISIGRLFSDDISEHVLKEFAKQGLIEGSEELATSLANTIADCAIMADKSELMLKAQEYMDSDPNLSQEEAMKKAWTDMAVQYAWDFVGGVASGGVMGGGKSAYLGVSNFAKNTVNNWKQNTATGEAIMRSDSVDALMALAKEKAGVTDAKMQNNLSKQASKVASRMEKNSTGGSTARKVGRLYDTVATAYSAQDQADIVKSLTRGEDGFTTKYATAIAEALVAQSKGQNLTDTQAELLDSVSSDAKVQNAVESIVKNQKSTVGQRSRQLSDFNGRVAAGVVARAANTQSTGGQKTLPESHYTASEDGKVVDNRGENITVTGVESVGNGGMILKTETGTIDAADVRFASEDEALIYSAVSNMDIAPATAWNLIKGFKASDGVSAQEYAAFAPLAYKYGWLNYRAGLRNIPLPDGQKTAAFFYGVNDAEAEVKAKTSKESTSTIKSSVATVSDQSAEKKIIFEGFTYNEENARPLQKASIAAIDMINKMSSLEVHVYQSVKKNGKFYANLNGKLRLAPNGYFTDGNKIYIDINAGNKGEGAMLYAMAHEVGHYIARYNAADFKAISDFLFEHYGEDVPIYDLLEEKKQTLIKSYETDGKDIPGDSVLEREAQEELVCDMLSRMFADQNAYDKLMELKQKDLTRFQKLGAAIKKVLDKLKKLLGVYESQNPDFLYAASVENFGEDAFRQLQDLYLRAFVKADENFQKTEKSTTDEGDVETDIRLSERDETAYKHFATKVNSVINQSITGKGNINGKVQVMDIMPVGPRLAAMVAQSSGNDIDISQRSIALNTGDIWHEYKRHTNVTDEVSRGQVAFTRRQFQNAVKCMISPDIVETIFTETNNPTQKQSFAYAKKTQRGHYVVVEAVGGKKNPSIYPVMILQFSKTKWDKMMEQGKTLGEILFENDIKKLNALDVDKNKKSRVTAAQFASYEAIANTLRSPQPTTTVSQQDLSVNQKFSDRDYSYETLVSKPDMTVTQVGGNVPTNRADVVYQAKQNAAKVGKFDPKTGSVSVYVEDIDQDIVLGTSGLKHGLDRRSDVTALVTLRAGEILKNAIRLNEMTPKKAEAEASYALIGVARNEANELYVVRFVVNRFSNEVTSMDVLHAINAKKGNRLRSMRPGFQGPVTDSTITIADLLDLVNQYFPDILPESVLKHYGYDARPEGDLGEDVLYQERSDDSVSNRSLLANALESVAQNETEKQKIQEYKGKIEMLDAQERKLQDLNEQIKELSFAKGPRDTKKINELRLEKTRTENRIGIYDKQLLRLEASKALQDVLGRERAKAFRRGKEKAGKTLENYRESRKRSFVKEKIKKFKKRLETMLQRPTDSQYIPVGLIGAMVDVCELINTDTDLYKADGSINKAQQRRNLTKDKLQELRDEYEKLKTSDPAYAGEFDEVVYNYLGELRQKVAGRHLDELSLDELTEMYEYLVSIEETLRDARKLIGWGDAEGVYEAADAIVSEQDAITQSRKKGERNAFGKVNDAALNQSLSPMRNVERMSGYNGDSYLLKLFKKFEQGIRKKNKFTMDAYKQFERFAGSKEYDDAMYKEVEGKKYTDASGRQFGVSKMLMMQAVLSYEREQANDLHHIEKDGFTFADLKMLKKGNLKAAVSEEYAHRVPSAVRLVAEFNEALKGDKWCQDYMAAARTFFNETAKNAVNETSIALNHRIIARDKNYIPFEVDKNFVVREISAQNDVQQTINSYGMLKETQKGAPQPLIITGLNNILDRHIDQVGNLYGLAVEIRNFNKVWNARSVDTNGDKPTVKSMVEKNWGKDGIKHIEQAVQDIQGPRVRERSAAYDKVKSNYIGATFLLNLSVVTKQIGSMYSAVSMLRFRGPVRQFGNLVYTMIFHKKISAEVDQYTATAWMRRQGLSDAELHTLMTEGKRTFMGRLLRKLPAVINPTKWITAMDHAVALSLWRYAKIDTAKKTGLKGEELLKATAEFYDEVVESTQSMTDVLHRPEIQKSGNVFAESFAMFKTDLYQMAGQLQTAAGRFFADPSKENAGALARSLYSVVMSTLWGQLMTTVFALLRYKVNPYRDEEDKDLTVKSWLTRQAYDLAADLAGYIFPILGSEIVGIFERIEYGESEDIVGGIAPSAINEVVDILITTASAFKDGEMPEPTQTKKLVAKALQLFGVPANNILRTWEAIQLHAKDIANGEFLSFEAGADRTNANHIHRIIEAADEGDIYEAKELYEDALMEQATEKAGDGGYGEDELKDAATTLKTTLGNKYKDGEVSRFTVTRILTECFEENADKAEETVREWDFYIQYGFSYNDKAKAYRKGTISASQLKTILMSYGDMTSEEAEDEITAYDWVKEGYVGTTADTVGIYNKYCAASEVPKDVFFYIRGFKAETPGDKDADGDTIPGSKARKVIAEIGAQPGLSDAQRMAIARSCGYADSTIYKYKTW